MADDGVKQKILVLGFYDRANLGDEQYKATIPLWFGTDHEFDFMCIDDLCNLSREQRDGYDKIIVGGGDVINAYFMSQLKPALSSYTGPVYAFSVGIPYLADAEYLDMFDHVITRSRGDYEIASAYLGPENVSCMPDVGFMHPFARSDSVPSDAMMRVGVCLATPVVIHYPSFAEQFATAMAMFSQRQNKPVQYNFFMFNTHKINDDECDSVAVDRVLSACSDTIRDACVIRSEIDGASAMLTALSEMDFALCMRYHGLVFATTAQAPTIVLAATPKIERLAKDLKCPDGLIVCVDADTHAQQLVDAMVLRCEIVHEAQLETHRVRDRARDRVVYDLIHTSRYRHLLMKTRSHAHDSFESALADVKRSLNTFYGSEVIDDALLRREGPFPLGDKDALRVSRIICFGLARDFDHGCVWGLAENMMSDGFVLYDACEYIYALAEQQQSKTDSVNVCNYYPSTSACGRVFVDVDPLDFKLCESHVHRSGWKYVTNHIANLDAKRFGKESHLILDTYIDRTFHWGLDSLVSSDLLPYKSAWAGFLHHTFDTTHSVHNNVELFGNPVFVESLKFCKCIIVMSHYLAKQVREALIEAGHPGVRVDVLCHPTEFLPRNRMFTMTRFVRNRQRKVIQIGAWLRNPYSIFNLALPPYKNRLALSKAALQGRNMEGYYITAEQYQKLQYCLLNGVVPGSPIHACDGNEYPSITTKNKYMCGLLDVVRKNHASVEKITNLDNDAYDLLLTKHVVFLDLVDCSAANTVIECIVRNTVIVVNRHPALEELLGVTYPGFYDSMYEATTILCSPKTLIACYKHIAALDKTQLDVNDFMTRLVQLLASL